MRHLIRCFAYAIALTFFAALAAPGPKQLFSLTIAAPRSP